jgi:hypothetical protein
MGFIHGFSNTYVCCATECTISYLMLGSRRNCFLQCIRNEEAKVYAGMHFLTFIQGRSVSTRQSQHRSVKRDSCLFQCQLGSRIGWPRGYWRLWVEFMLLSGKLFKTRFGTRSTLDLMLNSLSLK